MASLSLKEKYTSLIQNLFPSGWAWLFSPDNILTAMVSSLSWEPARVEERAFDFLDELDPMLTFEMVEHWERVLGIPDECTPENSNPSLYDRRVRITQKLTTGGGQSPNFFKLVAQQLGYNADVLDIKNFRDFRAGLGRVGEPVSNSTSPDGTTNESGWVYTFRVKAPPEMNRPFRAGQGTTGEKLVRIENETLECVIRKFAPAHVTVLFSYSN